MEHRKFLQRLDELVVELTHAQAQKVMRWAFIFFPRKCQIRQGCPKRARRRRSIRWLSLVPEARWFQGCKRRLCEGLLRS